jgi:hypothetical protein
MLLQTLEKRLQAMTQRLPSLGELQQQRSVPGRDHRKSTLIKPATMADDAEVKGAKKILIQMRTRKAASKSALVRSRFHHV